MQITTFFFGAPVWAGLQRLFFEKSMSGIPVWGRSPETLILFNFPKGLWKFYVFSLSEKDFEVFILFLSGICLKNTLNNTFFWFSGLESLSEKTFVWTFLIFLCLESLFENTWTFCIFSVWNPSLKKLWTFLIFLCLKRLWILNIFLCLKSPSEKTLNF